MALDVLLTPLPSRRNQFAPGKLVRTPIVAKVREYGTAALAGSGMLSR